jgi:uncharacterized protein YaaQ
MILLVAIVQTEDAGALTTRLAELSLRTTQINSSGGFLESGNAAILIGVNDDQCEMVIGVIKETCHPRTRFINAAPLSSALAQGLMAVVAPLEVEVGGAVVFGFPVVRFVRLQGGTAPAILDEKYIEMENPPMQTGELQTATGHTVLPMMLVIAIVQKEEVDAVSRGLVAANYRLTRINTAGGFLRRGNATLLVGVEPDHVDNVVSIIQSNCRTRSEPNPVEEGIPMYGATVFVLDASHFVRV